MFELQRDDIFKFLFLFKSLPIQIYIKLSIGRLQYPSSHEYLPLYQQFESVSVDGEGRGTFDYHYSLKLCYLHSFCDLIENSVKILE